MRSSKSRSRNKSNRQRTLGNIVNRVFDSSGPEGKVRGTPQQIIDKYLTLARDAQLSNDRVAEQSFLQHAEHYTRMLGEAQREQAERQAQNQQNQHQGNYRQNGDDDRDGFGRGGQDQGQPQPQHPPQNQQQNQPQAGQIRHDQQAQVQDGDTGQPAEAERHQGRPARAPRAEVPPQQGGLPDVLADDAEGTDSELVETPESQPKPKPKRARTPRTEGQAAATPRSNAGRGRRKADPKPDSGAAAADPAEQS
ncbi:DUF4167 domain-containing protein [Paracoccus sp. M683]|uniref:DUF4167 domain-containing protein n=1 Tax=Paracoccus sp. M683 TaxID=2594268 RepID=UPI001180F985|nr:DUF4167 domain-containing protein [Paracoccus sp. M683]TRW98123.1 DUF4167 domain-containing protein [Paracoccus sp. M683]